MLADGIYQQVYGVKSNEEYGRIAYEYRPAKASSSTCRPGIFKDRVARVGHGHELIIESMFY
jgi:hypothetical protein